MKKLERFLLSIIRRPAKTILLMLVVFVAGNVITGSFIIYHATQKVSDHIHEQIVPTVTIQKGKPSMEDDRYDDERYKDALLEISQFEEASYADFGFQSDWQTLDKTKNLSIHFANLYTTYDNHLFRFDNLYNEATMIGVYQPNSYYFYGNRLKMVEGRLFNEEEIREGLPVVLLPANARKLYPIESADRYGTEEFKLNEKIKFVVRIYDKKPIWYPDFFDDIGYYIQFTPEEIDTFQQTNEENILYEEVIEATIIGFYKISDPKDHTFYNDSFVYMPLNFLIHRNEKYNQKLDEYIEKGVVNSEGYINNSNSLTLLPLYNHFELHDNSQIEGFVKKVKNVLSTYDIDANVEVNNDLYMKVVGPLSTVNDMSKLVIIVAIVVVLIILSCLSLIFMKERKKEIGILLSLGECKRKVVMQMMAEILLVGLLGIAGSMLTAKEFGKKIADNIISMNQQSVTLTEEEYHMMNGLSPVAAMNEYEEYLDDTNILFASSISLMILLVSSGCIVGVIARMNPKDILL